MKDVSPSGDERAAEVGVDEILLRDLPGCPLALCVRARLPGPVVVRGLFLGRGSAWGDFDNDGNIDLVISNLNDHPILLRNDGGNRLNHWLTVDAKLKFPTGSPDAIGARSRSRRGR